MTESMSLNTDRQKPPRVKCKEKKNRRKTQNRISKNCGIISKDVSYAWSQNTRRRSKNRQKKILEVNIGICSCSVAQLCLTLCDPMDCSTPGFPVHHQLLKLAQTHVHRVGDHPTILSSVVPFSSSLQSFPASGSFLRSQFFALSGCKVPELQLQHQFFQ